MNPIHLTSQVVAFISAPKIHTDLLWDLTLLFIGLGVLYFSSIFFFRNRLSARAKRIADQKKKLGPMISEFLFYEDDSSKEEKSNYLHLKIEIRELLKHKFNRIVLTEILLDLERDVSGDAHKQLCKLYYDLGLHLDAFKKLKSWRWETVSKGILELTRMQVAESFTFITRFINDKRSVIRKQAEIATVTLKHEGINYFLDTTRYKISEWQQLKLLDVIRNLEEFEPPRFKAWLTSKNKHVVLFALRLIKYYNQNDANASIIELVKHKNNQIKTEAIYCIREFCVFEAIPDLKKVYWKCGTEIKLLILDALGTLGKQEEIDFLKFVELKEINFVIKSKALSAINAIAPQTIMPTEGVSTHLEEVAITAEMLEDKEVLDYAIFEAPISSQKEMEIAELDTYDENVWDQCLKDELEEISRHNNSSSQEEVAANTVPLDFLPVVVEDVSEELLQANKKASEEYEEKEEVEFVSLAFLPVVVEEEIAIPSSQMDNHHIEVIAEMVTVEAAEKSHADASSLLHIQVVFEEVIGTVKLPNLEDIPVIAEEIPALDKNAIVHLEVHEAEVVSNREDLHNIIVIADEIKVIQTDKATLPNAETPKAPVKSSELNEILVIFDTIIAPAEQPDKNEIAFQDSIEALEIDFSSMPSFEEVGPEEEPLTEASLLENMHYRLPGSVFRQLYFDKDERNKILLLDTIGDVGDQREIPLLKEIILNENSPLLKERALEVLNKVSETSYRIMGSKGTLVHEDELKGESIFNTLFHAGDKESKLLLIAEAAEVGCWKEVSFLDGLQYHSSKQVRDRARNAKLLLENRLQRAVDYETNKPSPTEEIHPTASNEHTPVFGPKNSSHEDHTTPLEFCFLLNELEIETLQEPESDLLQLAFELEQDVKEESKEDLENKNKEQSKPNIAKNSLFESLLDIPLKIIDRLNG